MIPNEIVSPVFFLRSIHEEHLSASTVQTADQKVRKTEKLFKGLTPPVSPVA